ncbi:MAG TPA: hypothetical protein VHZ78_13475 [Rhizomicrobium sp.]|nr:hypothetical protein [Rhizomicrobium sp.]
MSTEQNPPTAPLNPEQLFHPGTIAERVDVMMSVLTQGVVDCMIFATGAFPSLTEGEPEEPNAFAKPKPAGLSSWQAARSAELRDAARLTEASARLLTGFAKLRGQFSQDFTIRHNEKRGAGKKTRQRNSTVTHRFSVPAREAVSQTHVDPKMKSDLTRNLAGVAESLAAGRSQTRAAERDDKNEAALDELYRRLGIPRPAKDDEPDDTANPAGDPPPPPTGS